MRTERLRNLYREGAHPARGAVDQDRLPGLHVAVVTKCLQGDSAGHRHGRGLFEGEVCRLDRQVVFGRGGVPGVRAKASTEDLLTRLKPGHLGTHGRDLAGHVCAPDAGFRLAHPVHRPGDIRQSTHDCPVARIDARGPNANQYLTVRDLGRTDVLEYQDLGRAIRLLHHCLHRASLDLWSRIVRAPTLMDRNGFIVTATSGTARHPAGFLTQVR